ncbi:hypothetical protein D3C71_1248250 [compost metagenome]
MRVENNRPASVGRGAKEATNNRIWCLSLSWDLTYHRKFELQYFCLASRLDIDGIDPRPIDLDRSSCRRRMTTSLTSWPICYPSTIRGLRTPAPYALRSSGFLSIDPPPKRCVAKSSAVRVGSGVEGISLGVPGPPIGFPGKTPTARSWIALVFGTTFGGPAEKPSALGPECGEVVLLCPLLRGGLRTATVNRVS